MRYRPSGLSDCRQRTVFEEISVRVKNGAKSDKKSYDSSESDGRERVLVIFARYGPRVCSKSGSGWALWTVSVSVDGDGEDGA